MNDSATSLDRLHDIVVPAPVPFWPPAPGWYAVTAIALCVLGISGYHWWKRWQADAYRRAALKELVAAESTAEISELLRRVALAGEARRSVAVPIGSHWPQWLAAQCPTAPMSPSVREQLAIGAYRPEPSGDVAALREYAAQWIHGHQPGAATAIDSRE